MPLCFETYKYMRWAALFCAKIFTTITYDFYLFVDNVLVIL